MVLSETELPSISQLSVRLAARSHPGAVPQKNEDACVAVQLPTASAVVVADGAGGHSGGEVASDVVVRSARRYLEKLGSFEPRGEVAGEALRAAQRALRDAIAAEPRLHDMRSTGLVVLVTRAKAWVAHVGDSRAYLVRDGVARQLTRDDTLVQALVEMGQLTPEKARNHSKSNVLMQSLGQAREDLEFHVSEPLAMRSGDVIVACSDGLTDVVTDEEIARDVYGPSRAVAERLLQRALDAGAPDNVTVAVVSWRPRKKRPSIAAQSVKARSRRAPDRFARVATVVLLLAIAAMSAALLARHNGMRFGSGGRFVLHLPQ